MGSRLRSVISDVPKPMADIAGRPFLERQICYFRDQGFKKFTILAGYKGDLIERHFGNGDRLGVEIRTLIEREPLGTGGALRFALTESGERHFFLINGDSMLAGDYRYFLKYASQPFAIALHYTSDLSRYGAVEVGERGKIRSFIEKSNVPAHDGFINAGVYSFTREILNWLPEGPSSIERDVFPKLCEKGLLSGLPLGGRFIDIGIPESYQLACEKLPGWLDAGRRPCLFLDRDGTLIRHVNYLHKSEDVDVIPEMIEAIRFARENDWWTVMVTNQSGVARGMFTEADCHAVHDHIDDELIKHGVHVDRWFLCPFHPHHGSGKYLRESPLRKPGPGMILRAMEELPIDLERSVMAGDHPGDQIDLPGLRCLLIRGDYDLSQAPEEIVLASHAEFLRVLKTLR